MKTYKGKFTPRNKQKYRGDVNNIVYRSQWEKQAFLWCDNNSNVLEWSSEHVIIPYFYEPDKKYHRYFPDLLIRFANKTLLVEIKPKKETQVPKNPNRSKRYINESLTYVKNICKWEAANKFCKKKGWGFAIWTEDELKKIGILNKGLGKVPGKLDKHPSFKKKKKK